MGLDTIEIVLRSEEVFGVDLPDDECATVITVGDFYRLILNKLNLPYQPIAERGSPHEDRVPGRDRSQSQFPSLISWNSGDAWVTLRGIIHVQLQVDFDEIRVEARFVQDLGCD